MTDASGGTAFSVVVPTLGRLGQLDGCLASLAALDFDRDRFEVILVDDEGRGGVERVGDAYRDELPLRVVGTGGGAGPSAARNLGAQRAEGRWLAFTDDDCRASAGWLDELEAVLESDPGAAAGGRMENGAPGAWAAASQAVLDAAHKHFNDSPEGPRFFASCNVAFPREAFLEVGGFDERFEFSEDRELCERWLHSGRRFAFAPDALVTHMRQVDPGGLWRQHFGYGRGAWRFHRTRQERGWGSFRIEPGFYRRLAVQIRDRPDGTPLATVAAGALMTQAAAAAGFATEGLATRRATPTGPSR